MMFVATLSRQLEAAGVKDKSADHVASHLGKAVGLSTILRGTSHHANARRCYIPVELLAKHKVCIIHIFRQKIAVMI
jgi:NADH dehydrogenase [ubiquinone] 1 alpha subcomplex assembly factor 6